MRDSSGDLRAAPLTPPSRAPFLERAFAVLEQLSLPLDALLLLVEQRADGERGRNRPQRDLPDDVPRTRRAADDGERRRERHLVRVRDEQLPEHLMPEVALHQDHAAKNARERGERRLSQGPLPGPPSMPRERT